MYAWLSPRGPFFGAILVLSLASVFLTGWWWQELRDRQAEADAAHFNRLADDAVERVVERVQAYEQALRAGAGLFAANRDGAVSRDAWRRFVTTLDLDRNYPGMLGLGFIRRVPAAALGDYAAGIRRAGVDGFTVSSVPGTSLSEPSAYVIEQVEPAARNAAATGLDIGSEPNRREAADLASATGQTRMTRPITLVQDERQTAGFLILLPIPRETGGPEVPDWVYAPLIGEQVCAGVLPDVSEIAMAVVDGVGDDPMVIYASEPDDAAAAHLRETSLLLAGMPWRVRIWSTGAFRTAADSTSDSALLAAALGFSVLLTTLLVLMYRGQGAALARAKDSDERLQVAADAAGLGLWHWTVGHDHLRWNPRMFTMFGVAPREGTLAVGDFLACVHPADRDGISAALEAAIAGSGSYRTEYRVIQPDGSTTHVLAAGRVIHTGAEGPAMAGVCLDITDRVKAREDLERTTRINRLFVEHAPAAIAIFDKDLRYLAASRRWYEDYGLEGSPLVGRSHYDVFPEIVEGHPWRDLHQRCLAGEVLARAEDPFDRGDGRTQWLQWALHPWREPDGSVGGLIMFTQDVTAQVLAREALDAAREEATAAREVAERAALAKADFLATMSHEIRTPMNGVIGMCDVLLGSDLDAQQREWANTIQSCGETLLSLLNDILDLSKIEAGRLELESRPVDLRALVHEVGLVFAEEARRKGITVDIAIAPALPARLLGDEIRLRQVLFNLVSNAVKFTERGGVRIAVDVDRHAAGRTALRLQVSDTGIGIPADHRDRLFQPFTQADASTTRRYGGTGLGLTITRQLVELMGGSIALESTVGAGTTLTIELALADTAEPGAAPSTGEGSGTPAGARARSAWRVLVAEDNPVNQRLIRLQVGDRARELVVVDDGAAAVAAHAAGEFDLVLMDCQMPVMDGFAATEAIRRAEAAAGRPRVPIVAITANALRGDRERCLAAGMDEYLTKPLRRADLERLFDGLDPATARPETFDGLRASIGETGIAAVLDVACASLPDMRARLDAAAQAADAAGLADAAHVIKGTALVFEAGRLVDAAEAVVGAGRAGDVDAALAALPALRSAVDDALREWQQARSAG